MFDEIQVLDQQIDTEFDAWLASLPEPSEQSLINYQRIWDFMLKINAEVGVFQDVQFECAPEEAKVANNGKYMSHSYVWRYGRDEA